MHPRSGSGSTGCAAAADRGPPPRAQLRYDVRVERPSADDEVYDENGVDRSLIRWFLSLSPLERLAALDDAMRLAELAEESRDSSR